MNTIAAIFCFVLLVCPWVFFIPVAYVVMRLFLHGAMKEFRPLDPKVAAAREEEARRNRNKFMLGILEAQAKKLAR